MKALFGVVSLLVALAIVGMLAARQMKAVGHIGSSASTGAATAADVPQAPVTSASGTVREQAIGIESKVSSDVAKALNQGAAAREEEANKAGSDK